MTETTLLVDEWGSVIGTYVPAGQDPPFSPPEPPTASAAVGRPPYPRHGGPGAAAVAEVEEQDNPFEYYERYRDRTP